MSLRSIARTVPNCQRTAHAADFHEAEIPSSIAPSDVRCGTVEHERRSQQAQRCIQYLAAILSSAPKLSAKKFVKFRHVRDRRKLRKWEIMARATKTRLTAIYEYQNADLVKFLESSRGVVMISLPKIKFEATLNRSTRLLETEDRRS